MNLDELAALENEAGIQQDPVDIDRSDVGVRIVYSLLFAVILSVLEPVLFAVVAYQLIYSLVTQRVPGKRVQAFANGIIAYFRQILRYITHNDSVIPFPFSDFPEPLEPTLPPYSDSGDEPTTHYPEEVSV